MLPVPSYLRISPEMLGGYAMKRQSPAGPDDALARLAIRQPGGTGYYLAT
jgi:hypothetical protein